MKKIPIDFFKHVNESMATYRWFAAITVSFLIAISFAMITLNYQIKSDQEIFESLSPYLATLVESSDRPEMIRVMNSTAKTRQSDFLLIKDGKILSSTRNISELDTNYVFPKATFQFLGSDFLLSEAKLIFNKQVKSGMINSEDVFFTIVSPLRPILIKTIVVFLLVFSFSISVSFVSTIKTKKAIKTALAPLEQLNSEIKELGVGLDNGNVSKQIPIMELENIRQTVVKTKIELENANDRLAEIKAKKLNADSYKRLIHDLHNPVSALKQMTKIIDDPSLETEDKESVVTSIVRLSDQILNQITAARKNLSDEPLTLRELDIRDCINDCISQNIISMNKSKKLVSEIPLEQVVAAHDPVLLKRAITNLIENAIEASTSLVKVSLTKSDKFISINISDDGPGIKEENIPVYFQGRGNSSKANRQAFGLSSTNHIVRTHGGKLIYKLSDLGGANFEIRLGAIL